MIQTRDKVFIGIVVAAVIYAFVMFKPVVVEPKPPEPAVPVVEDLAHQGILVTPEGASVTELPDFKRYSDVKQKKAKFFAFMLPLVELENNRVLIARAKLLSLHKLSEGAQPLSMEQRQWLFALAKQYRVDPEDHSDKHLIERLMSRVDIVPASMALSQSANESAWGTSRFAVEGNNLFGQWCFKKGCGLIPQQRPEGASYEVAVFDTPADSVGSYIRNLNTNSAYLYFRELRRELRLNNQELSGEHLAQGLMSYSIRGEHYISEVQAMIRVNKLARYDAEESGSSDG